MYFSPLSWMNQRYLLSGFLLFVMAFAATYYFRSHRLYQEPALELDKRTELYLHKASGIESLAVKLENKGWLQNKEMFLWAGELLGWNRFRTGRYELSPQMDYKTLFNKLGRGIQDPMEVTILPGMMLTEFQQHMARRFSFDSTAIKQVFQDSSYLNQKGLSQQQLFGRMLPDTYRFYWTASPKRVIEAILTHFNDQVAAEFKERLENIRFSLSEIVTLASIIEWESGRESEMPIISGLYWNRLNKGMRLQADPTVLYAIGEQRRLYFEDYRIQHPYNTYIHDGLPPGPITNPSRSSIKAALNPAEHDYLFMVATPEGSHLFSETFEEHKRKSRNWRKWIQKQYRLKREREQKEEGKSGGSG